MFEKVQFTCADGYVLQGRFFPKQPALKQQDSTHLPILIGAATGIKQGFYQAFAKWLTEQGYDVMTFDFRGIGDSLYEPVSKSKAFIHQWGQLDLVSAIDFLTNKTNSAQIHLMKKPQKKLEYPRDYILKQNSFSMFCAFSAYIEMLGSNLKTPRIGF